MQVETEGIEHLGLDVEKAGSVEQFLLLLTVDYLDYVVVRGGQVFINLGRQHDAYDSKLDKRWGYSVKHCKQS